MKKQTTSGRIYHVQQSRGINIITPSPFASSYKTDEEKKQELRLKKLDRIINDK